MQPRAGKAKSQTATGESIRCGGTVIRSTSHRVNVKARAKAVIAQSARLASTREVQEASRRLETLLSRADGRLPQLQRWEEDALVKALVPQLHSQVVTLPTLSTLPSPRVADLPGAASSPSAANRTAPHQQSSVGRHQPTAEFSACSGDGTPSPRVVAAAAPATSKSPPKIRMRIGEVEESVSRLLEHLHRQRAASAVASPAHNRWHAAEALRDLQTLRSPRSPRVRKAVDALGLAERSKKIEGRYAELAAMREALAIASPRSPRECHAQRWGEERACSLGAEVCSELNEFAMECVPRDPLAAVEVLRRALAAAATGDANAKLLTWSNLAICWMQLGSPSTAARYLRNAEQIAKDATATEPMRNGSMRRRQPSAMDAVDDALHMRVLLNLCTALNQLGQHSDALSRAQAAAALVSSSIGGMEVGGSQTAGAARSHRGVDCGKPANGERGDGCDGYSDVDVLPNFCAAPRERVPRVSLPSRGGARGGAPGS